MSTPTEFDLETFLSTVDPDLDGIVGSESTGATGTSKSSLYEPGYEGKIDYRIRQLSHSSRELFAQCPRRYQLYRLRTTHRTEESIESSITFAYGHVVGEAIQLDYEGYSESEVIFKMFCNWKPDLLVSDDKRFKNFWSAVIAYQRFRYMRAAGFLDDYELVYFNGKPACELSFCINFPDGFRYRGFVDVVLKHKVTGEVMVLENKTTWYESVNPNTYRNSGQAIGYSVVLDHIFPGLSAYQVLYLVYSTKSREFTPIPFTKSYLQRALWIRELLLDIELIKMYEDAEVYPMRGNNCVSFGRDCEYIQSCTLSTDYLKSSATAADFDTTEYQVNVSLLSLLESQFAATSTDTVENS